jgi:hypothetical protein
MPTLAPKSRIARAVSPSARARPHAALKISARVAALRSARRSLGTIPDIVSNYGLCQEIWQGAGEGACAEDRPALARSPGRRVSDRQTHSVPHDHRGGRCHHFVVVPVVTGPPTEAASGRARRPLAPSVSVPVTPSPPAHRLRRDRRGPCPRCASIRRRV